MGDLLKCPLCCDKTFRSKPLLVEHLASVLGNICCPICNNKWTSLAHLIEHLTLDNCQPDNTIVQEITFDVGLRNEGTEIISENTDTKVDVLDDETLAQDLNDLTNKDEVDESTEVGKMYVELLSKQLMKPCLQTQELKLVKEHGVSRYVIMTNDDSNMSGSTVVTKQNNDGTISLTTVKDLKTDSETVITQETEAEEVYSCNTCGVSFTSVLDHIQNYHNDQDVVLEEPGDDSSDRELPIEYGDPADPLSSEELLDKQAPRRMITETGDIVEAPNIILKNNTISLSEYTVETNKPDVKEEIVDKEGRVYTRRYVQIDKFCESVVKDIKQPEDKDGPYHKVVVKEMESTDGQKVKVYNCMSCNIYVLTLDDFKLHPCKTLKYNCPHCPVAYENSKSLCAHMKVHKSKPCALESLPAPVSYSCEVCSTIFTTHKSLKLHKRMHDPIKSRPIEPPVETAEGGEASTDKFLCQVCNKLIPIDYQIIHQNSHKTTEKFNCDICNKKFQSHEYLEMHMSVHATDKVTIAKQDKSLPYTCLYCDRRFARPHEKVKHERIHTGEKPHSCEICGKSFRVSYCLTLHMRTHTGARPYACSHCGKRFKAHSVYNHHLLTHSEVRAYKCPYCPKAFKTSVQLAGHKNSHTKPFACTHCNRPFASLYAVRVHTETHARQNNLKFSCKMCGASYARAFALKDHVKQVHKQDVEKKDQVGIVLKTEDWAIRQTDSEVETKMQTSKDLSQEVPLI